MRRTFITILLGTIIISNYAQELLNKSKIIEQMNLINNYWIAQNPNPGNNQWARAVYFTGNIDFYKAYAKEKYNDYSKLWANNNNWSLNGGNLTRNADNQTCGQVYLDLYNLDKTANPTKIYAIKTSIDNMLNSNKSDDWWWVDAMYMSMPVFMRMGILNNDSSYFNRMYELYYNNKVTRGLYNTTSHLWYRDESFKPPYSTKNNKDSYWSRGNGWVIAAHVRVLQLLPKSNSHYKEFAETFQQMAAALKERQRTDGFWNPSLDDPDEFTGPETSGTAFFTYGIAWGINNHLLDSATYFPLIQKAWEGLNTIAVQANGFLGYVQGVGASPALAYANTTQDFGVGAYLLAGTEMLKIAKGEMPNPINFGIKKIVLINKNQIQLTFSNTIDITTALNIQNYSIDKDVQILNISKVSNDSSVNIATSTLSPNKYTLTINNIKSSTGEIHELYETKSFVYNSNIKITASDFEAGTANTPDKTMDFDLSTRWSANNKGQWIMYDLNEVKKIKSVDVAFFNGAIRKSYFKIELSTDSVIFDEVINLERLGSSGSTNELENYDFADRNARYIKITCYGNSQSTWNSITETVINSTDLSSSTSKVQQNNVKIFPNPCNGKSINIQSDETYTDICIYNTAGIKVYETKEQTRTLNNLNLSIGMYYIQMSNEKTKHYQFFIVK